MSDRRAHLWIPAILAHALALLPLYPGSYHQDGGHHFLSARWGWEHPVYLVDPWNRPLFTALYSIPAQLGYLPARLLSAAIIAATGYVTYCLAKHLGFKRAWLAYPLLALHPHVMLLLFDTMTEPLFALFLALALLLHTREKPLAAAIVVSFLPTIRPEGFPLGIFWGFLMLLDHNVDPRPLKRWLRTLVLLLGTLLWVLASWIITGDPLYIVHNWPYVGDRPGDRSSLPVWFALLVVKFIGPIIFLLAITGSLREARLKRWILPALAAYFFLFQVVLFEFELFGSVGEARYFVCIAPITTLLAISGTQVLERHLAPRAFATGLGGALLFSWVFALFTFECHPGFYDARAVRETYNWYRDNVNAPVRQLIWSQNYMSILFDQDLQENPIIRWGHRDENLKILTASPPGTLAFFDAISGPYLYKIDADDFETAGYRRLRSKKYVLRPLWVPFPILGECGPRKQEMHLFYKN